MLCGEATNTNFIVFGLTDPTINRIQSEHANHYTTDAVCFVFGTLILFKGLL
jgi:hypothetical protein